MLQAGILDVEKIRRDFPILQRKIHGQRLVYLDSAATTRKPGVGLQKARRIFKI